jgi:glucose uptake protein
MILPGSQLFNILMLALGALCLGTWANTFKMTSRWRYELYYFDFALGAVLAATIIGLTFGSLGWDGFALADDFHIAGKLKEALAVAAGMIFNLGNMLILGALSVAGVTVAYLIGMSAMLAAGLVVTHFTSPSSNGVMLFGGAALVFVSAVLLAVAFRMHALARLVAIMREGKTKGTKKVVSLKGQVLALCGGLIASAYFPLIDSARSGENGLGPYSTGLLFTVGILFSTLIFGLFFMNLPVHGEPVGFAAYFNGKAKFHGLGLLGGVLFYIGFSSILIVARAEGRNIVSPVSARALLLTVPLVGTLWGLLRWHEFTGAGGRIKVILGIALFVFAIGAVGLAYSAGISTGG